MLKLLAYGYSIYYDVCITTPEGSHYLLTYYRYLHPLEGNVVYEEPIYDPDRPWLQIGKRVTYYAYDGITSIDVREFLPLPKDTISTVSLVYEVGENLTRPIREELASIGITLSCPEGGAVIKTISTLNDVNNAILLSAHLSTHDIIYYDWYIFDNYILPFSFPIEW